MTDGHLPMIKLNTRLVAAFATAVAGFALAAPAVGDPAPPRQWNFEVFLDDREIGYHRFELRNAGDALRLETRAEFEVKLLIITAFEYVHSNTELWQAGCLQRIEARTDSNGKRYEVSGEQRDGGFVLATGSGTTRIEDCVGSFAYWDQRLLQRGRLLNSQTGEYLEVELQRLPAATVTIGNREIAVDRYSLTARDMDITLAYAAGSGDWVALDSVVDGGRTLRYRRSPADFMGPAGLALAGMIQSSEALQ